MTAFREAVVGRITRTLPLSILSLVAMVVVDASLIVASIRFVGVSASELSAVWVLTAFLVAQAGTDVEAPLVAAFIIWRVVTIGTPLLLGVLSLGWWRLSVRAR